MWRTICDVLSVLLFMFLLHLYNIPLFLALVIKQLFIAKVLKDFKKSIDCKLGKNISCNTNRFNNCF